MILMTIYLPEVVMKLLNNVASELNMQPEEIVSELILEKFSGDPNKKIEMYLELYKKYMEDADKLIKQGDFLQASEKIWGAAASIVKAVALKKIGKRLASHGELREFVIRVANETKDDEIRLLWKDALSMHTNFYENWAPPEDVVKAFESVKKFAEKLAKYAGIKLK